MKKFAIFLLTLILCGIMLCGCDRATSDGKVDPDTDVSDTPTQDNGEPDAHQHVLSQGKYEDLDDEGNHYFTCGVCGEYVKGPHEFSIAIAVSSKGHYFVCECFFTADDIVSHELEDGVCLVCGWKEDPTHEHSYTEYSAFDTESHTAKCDCGDEISKSHTFNYEIQDDAFHYKTCVCGYRSQKGHDYNEDGKCTQCGYQGHVCEYTKTTYDDKYHYFVCECGRYYSATHNYYSDMVTEADARTHTIQCALCANKLTEAHNFDNGQSLLDRCSVCRHELTVNEGLVFERNDDGYTLVGMENSTDSYLWVPDTYKGLPVTAIGPNAFTDRTRITHVKLPNSIASIGAFAFANCTSLKTVNLPDKLVRIEASAFMNCSSFVGFSDTANFNYIAERAFYGCSAMDGSIILSGAIENEFGIILGDSEIIIGDSAFAGCSSLDDVYVSADIIHLGEDVFMGCSSLKMIEFAVPCLKYFPNNTFSQCRSLEQIVFISSINPEYNTEYAWRNVLANSVVNEEEGLSWYADSGNFQIVFEDPIKEVKTYLEKSELIHICRHDKPASEGLEFEKIDGGYCLIGIGNCEDTFIIVPDQYDGMPVIAIGNSAFEGNNRIIGISIPESVKSIGSSAFAGCFSLKEINLPDGITVIHDNTFMGCCALETLNLPKNLTQIEMFAFMGCTSFKGFEDYSQFTFIGDYAFADCTSLAGTLELIEISYVGSSAFSGCTSLTDVIIITNGPMILGGSAFSGCTSLKTVEYQNDGLEYFEIGTFSDCTALETIKIFGGTFDDFLDFFAESVVDEEFGLSWFDGCNDFTVAFIDPQSEDGQDIVVQSLKISEIYDYINENYWQ